MEEQKSIFDRLLMGYFSSTLSKEEEELFVRIVKSDPSLQKEFDEYSKLYAVSHIPTLEKEKAANYLLIKSQLPRKTIRKKIALFLKVASVLLLLVTTATTIYYINKDIATQKIPETITEVSVPLGSQTQVVLPDGSKVMLNSGSILRYNNKFGKENRNLFFKGEGFFEIVKKEIPLLVATEELDIKVHGTVFNVKAYPEDENIDVSLLEGKISIGTRGNQEDIALEPNERVVYNKKTKNITVFKADAQNSSLWTTGKLFVESNTIQEILRSVERKYNVKFRIESEQVKKETFSGTISTTMSLTELLDYLDVDKKYKFIRENDSIIVRDRKTGH